MCNWAAISRQRGIIAGLSRPTGHQHPESLRCDTWSSCQRHRPPHRRQLRQRPSNEGARHAVCAHLPPPDENLRLDLFAAWELGDLSGSYPHEVSSWATPGIMGFSDAAICLFSISANTAAFVFGE